MLFALPSRMLVILLSVLRLSLAELGLLYLGRNYLSIRLKVCFETLSACSLPELLDAMRSFLIVSESELVWVSELVWSLV